MRINVIPVEFLSNVHLRAEFREIIMSIHYYKRSSRSPKGIDESRISEKYTLNGGHAYFWYNKFGYILKRYNELKAEMLRRDYKIEGIDSKFLRDFNEFIPEHICNNYNPTKEDILINLNRIFIKPNLYSEKQFIEWCIFYSKKLNIDDEDMYYIIVKIEEENRLGLLDKHLKREIDEV